MSGIIAKCFSAPKTKTKDLALQVRDTSYYVILIKFTYLLEESGIIIFIRESILIFKIIVFIFKTLWMHNIITFHNLYLLITTL